MKSPVADARPMHRTAHPDPRYADTATTPRPLDLIVGTPGPDALSGTTVGSDSISGLGGNDTLDGSERSWGLGFGYATDTLSGGDGDDRLIDASYWNPDFFRPHTFKIDGGPGTDLAVVRVATSAGIRFAVADNLDGKAWLVYFSSITGVERISLDAGSGADTLQGGVLDDAFYGNGGDDILGGAAGADRLEGGRGRDTLRGGHDADWIHGDVGGDRIDAGAGDDRLDGGEGRDTLEGGRGNDTHVFSTAPSGLNVDTILQFNPRHDTLALDATVFSGLGDGTVLPEAAFHAAPGAVAAHDADDRIVYDTLTGWLYYDADGDGADHAAVAFAILENQPRISAAVFAIDS